MHAIFAPVEGLQLWDASGTGGEVDGGQWCSPGEIWPCFDPSHHIVILVNAELEAISKAIVAASYVGVPTRTCRTHNVSDGTRHPRNTEISRKRHRDTGDVAAATGASSRTNSRCESHSNETAATYRACVHRVVMCGHQPRLSVSYEIRTAFDVDAQTLITSLGLG